METVRMLLCIAVGTIVGMLVGEYFDSLWPILPTSFFVTLILLLSTEAGREGDW